MIKIAKIQNICIVSVFYLKILLLIFRTRCTLVSHNVPAAWRRRGFHCRSYGRQTSKFAQTFGRATAPLAPNRPLSAGICLLHIFVIFFIYSFSLNIIISSLYGFASILQHFNFKSLPIHSTKFVSSYLS